ncbi:glycosyltransferase involved in cell wall biosynthesis [Sphingopyxis italica]|uniref:Glycosyltransferase involved in cell wall biosynthesis n=1 Tax=Sphingopyxis italica TaxID=1129133 RepID=A0A7X6B850_9SPHN|nr:glycosyltransferase family 4 protein [Sphingopyxis italica]NJB88113.1 glycosyltransferase involved in cell wall biosynthesis [Sphingopyxis italica]
MANLLFITRKWTPAVGGMETYSHKLSEALRALLPVRIHRLAGRRGGSPPRAISLVFFALTSIIRIAAQRRPAAVVHLGDMALWPLGIAARLRSRKSRLILSAHGTDVAYPRRGGVKGRVYGLYLRLGARLLPSATVIANSEATRAVARESGWSCDEVIPLATDLAGPAPTGHFEHYILFAGRLVERKGCRWFIREVLPHLPPSVRLRIAGTIWDEEERAALRDPRVDFVGSLDGSVLVDAYRHALCVVVPNIETRSKEIEGFGLVATEAAAAGGIVIASRIDGLVQAVTDDLTGFLVPAGDSAEWLRAIAGVADWDRHARRSFAERSMAHCRTFYSWDRVARDTLGAYNLPLS